MSYQFPEYVKLTGFPGGPNEVPDFLHLVTGSHPEYQWIPPAGLCGVPVTTMKCVNGIWEISQNPYCGLPRLKKYGGIYGTTQPDPFGYWTDGGYVEPYYPNTTN